MLSGLLSVPTLFDNLPVYSGGRPAANARVWYRSPGACLTIHRLLDSVLALLISDCRPRRPHGTTASARAELVGLPHPARELLNAVRPDHSLLLASRKMSLSSVKSATACDQRQLFLPLVDVGQPPA
jgi:hypothetical protein